MSGLFKGGIGKIFRKVVKVIKKVALPALAIAAVVVTGGAALGLLPGITGLGGLAASLGASPLLAGVLSAAGTGATIGAIGGFVTTGSFKGALKGATTGLVTGAVAGGIGAAVGGGGGVTGFANPGTGGLPTALNVDPALGVTLPGTGDVVGQLGGQAASGIGGAVGQAASGALSFAPAAPSLTGIGSVAAGGGGGGGVLGFLNRNPLLASGLLKGIGGALQGDPNMRLLKARQKSYDVTGVYQPYDVAAGDGQDPAERFNTVIYGDGQYEYDPKSGRILPKVGG